MIASENFILVSIEATFCSMEDGRLNIWVDIQLCRIPSNFLH